MGPSITTIRNGALVLLGATAATGGILALRRLRETQAENYVSAREVGATYNLPVRLIRESEARADKAFGVFTESDRWDSLAARVGKVDRRHFKRDTKLWITGPASGNFASVKDAVVGARRVADPDEPFVILRNGRTERFAYDIVETINKSDDSKLLYSRKLSEQDLDRVRFQNTSVVLIGQGDSYRTNPFSPDAIHPGNLVWPDGTPR